MGQIVYVHVVDPNRNRGNEMARHLSERSFDVERHSGLSGLLSHPRRGVVLMSDDHEGPDPGKVLEAIENCAGYLPAAFFSSSLSARMVVRAMAAGVVDYFEWPCCPTELGEIVVRLSVQGERRATIETLKTHARELVERLTDREQEVLRSLVAGGSNKQIARELGISPRTVEVHRAHMMSRLNARSVSDAVRIGIYAEVDGVEADSSRNTTLRSASIGRSVVAG